MSVQNDITLKVLTTLLAQRIVALSTAPHTAIYPAALTSPMVGITLDTVLDTTGSLPVRVSGIAKVYMNDTCAAGDLIAGDSSGFGKKHVDSTAGSYVIGQALEASAATATVIQVLIQPKFKSIP
jgi:hypothetical protein